MCFAFIQNDLIHTFGDVLSVGSLFKKVATQSLKKRNQRNQKVLDELLTGKDNLIIKVKDYMSSSPMYLLQMYIYKEYLLFVLSARKAFGDH